MVWLWSNGLNIRLKVWYSDYESRHPSSKYFTTCGIQIPPFFEHEQHFLVPILLEDLSLVERPLSDSLKFLSSLDQELKWSKKRSADSEPVKKVKEENIVNVELKKICNMSIDQVWSN